MQKILHIFFFLFLFGAARAVQDRKKHQSEILEILTKQIENKIGKWHEGMQDNFMNIFF